MARATQDDGSLAPIPNCYIVSPCGNICLKILPDISDSKGANYTNENIPGRSAPITTFVWSEQRIITSELHFMVTTDSDIVDNFNYVNTIKQLVYPGPASGNAPFTPPPVAKFVCGNLLDGPDGLCVILKNYNIRYPREVAWDEATLLPYNFSVSCSWEVVYACQNLPSNTCIASNSSSSSSTTSSSSSTSNYGFRLRGR